MGWLDLAGKLCVVVPVIGGAMWGVYRTLYRLWLRSVMIALQAELNRNFEIMMRELKPNGGNSQSLGDTVVRLLRTTDEQTVILKNHSAILGKLTDGTDEITRTTDDTNGRLSNQIKNETLREPQGSPRIAEVGREMDESRKRIDQRRRHDDR